MTFGLPKVGNLLFPEYNLGGKLYVSHISFPPSITPFIASRGSEIVFVPQDETSAGSIALGNKQALLELSQQMDMVALGPGLSLEPETQRLVRELTREIEKPLLIDGDGITAICEALQIIQERKADIILTPHLGEISRLTRTSIRETDDNKVDVLQHTASSRSADAKPSRCHSLCGFSS